jgi:predicted MFS family arabinose efflux permease
MSHIENSNTHGLSPRDTFIFAIAGGAAVGNLYWAQPLLIEIAEAMNVPAASAGLLVTVTQVGYAIGVSLLMPLGDVVNRKKMIPFIFVCSAFALAASALAPTFSILLLALTAVGLTSIAGQLLVPLAGDLANNEQRGKVVGVVTSGILTGILASRTLSGLLADALGWRSIYVVASVTSVVMAIVLKKAVPELPAKSSVPYTQLLKSVLSVVRKHKVVRATLFLNAFVFSVFTMFWTALTFLLSAAPFSYSTSKIGLVGLVGLAGAVGAQGAGRFHDKGLSVPASGFALLLCLISLGLSAIGSSSISLILLAVVMIDIAIQTISVLNQTRLFSVEPSARSRLNTAYVTCNFIGGAIGSALAGILWQNGGWKLVMSGAGILTLIALLIWFFERTEFSLIEKNNLRAGSAK